VAGAAGVTVAVALLAGMVVGMPGSARAGEERAQPTGEAGPAVHWSDGVLTQGAVRYRLGQRGDQLVTGDWLCRGTVTPALYRPSTGVVWFFDAWPSTGQSLAPVRTVQSKVRGGVASVAMDGRSGCATVRVIP
jgi:hypothetical protein